MSPEFGESQTYPCTVDSGVGVFSPVTTPRQDRVHVDLNLAYTASESPDMRHVPNMFASSTTDATRALFDEMPGAHEVFGEMPGAHMMFTDEEVTTFMNDMFNGGIIDAGGEDVQVDEDEIEETIAVVYTDTGKTLGKRKPRGSVVGTYHSKWKYLEDECLIKSGKAASLDPIIGANQILGKYYTRIRDEFNEHRHIGEYAKVHMKRNESAISHRWSVIKTICNKFHSNL
jgi:hypothetical protein